jgi:hypothetical protein
MFMVGSALLTWSLLLVSAIVPGKLPARLPPRESTGGASGLFISTTEEDNRAIPLL